jgi:hypothetical protein
VLTCAQHLLAGSYSVHYSYIIGHGFIVAKAGDVAEGEVQDAKAGRDDFWSYKAANLRVSVDRVFNFCGDEIEIDFMRSEYRRRQGILSSHKDVLDSLKHQLDVSKGFIGAKSPA